MNTASSFFVLILLGSLLADAVAQVSYQEPAAYHPVQLLPSHQQRIISGRPLQPLRRWEHIEISDLLRLSMSESRDLEVVSVSVRAQAYTDQAFLELKSLGRSVSPRQLIGRHPNEARFLLPPLTRLDDLKLHATDDLMLDTLTLEVRDLRGSYYQHQPHPNQLLKLRIVRSVHGWGEINLKQLAHQQLGLNLEGSQIQRVVLQAHLLRGSSASVQLELNNRLMGPVKYIMHSSRNTPLLVNTRDSVQGALKLLIRGEVQITSISIRIGSDRRISY